MVALFRERLDKSPLDSPEKLAHFAKTRAAYVAQTALFGYLKTRMGTRFRSLFEDEVFSQSIRQASGRVFEACLVDLTLLAIMLLRRSDPFMTDDACARLALWCYTHALQTAQHESPWIEGNPQTFQTRLKTTRWDTLPEQPFAASAAALLEHAPVIDEFKASDGEIVKNSLRYRWIPVRAQLERRLPDSMPESS